MHVTKVVWKESRDSTGLRKAKKKRCKGAHTAVIGPNLLKQCFTLERTVCKCVLRTLKPKHLNPFPNKPWFLPVCDTSFLKTLWEKEKLLITSNFSFSHSIFYPCGELFAIFIKFEIVICKLVQFGRVQNLSFGKRLKNQIILCNFF